VQSAERAVVAYVALGANLGDAVTTLLQAMDAMAALPGTAVTRRSSLYRTRPVDSAGPDYVNAVVEVVTALPAPHLLQQLQNIEHLAGRERPYRNAPRTLDLDVLLYGNALVQSHSLTVPHPRMRERAFVLSPLAEIAPGLVPDAWLDAVSGQSIQRITLP
jgi:2-amino-4-hydroxy-6-hydroxymethyldihydropteridine diphosphokinase